MPFSPLRWPLPRFGPTHMVIAIAALLLGLFVYSAIQSAAQTHRLAEQHNIVEADIADLQTQVAELQGLREYLASDEYIEAVARTRFGLVYPGETAVIVEAPAAPKEPRRPGERWWEDLFTR